MARFVEPTEGLGSGDALLSVTNRLAVKHNGR